MSQEEYEKLPEGIRKSCLKCNVIGCKNVVCTHGGLCLDHDLGKLPIRQMKRVTCSECKGTGVYEGLNKQEACRECKGRKEIWEWTGNVIYNKPGPAPMLGLMEALTGRKDNV
jgi:DnaJ-class molecular chaperone